MKYFKRLFLGLLTLQILNATTNIIMPNQLQTNLCNKLSSKGCSSEEQLKVTDSFKLDNDKLLFFFSLYKPNAMYKHGYVNIPVIVDINQVWKIATGHMDAEIQEIARDPKGGLWVRTLWTIEGAYPTLYYSKDGTAWQSIYFPLKRNVNEAFEDLKICFLENEIQLTFLSMGGDEVKKAWKTSYRSAITKNPQWTPVPKDELCQQSCYKTSAYNNVWINKGQQSNFELYYVHKYKPYTVSIPTFKAQHQTLSKAEAIKSKPQAIPSSSKTYTIQLGTFNYLSSLEQMKKNLSQINYPFIDKKFTSDTTTKYRLYLGKFESKEVASNTLERLKNEHPQNKVFQGALIRELP